MSAASADAALLPAADVEQLFARMAQTVAAWAPADNLLLIGIQRGGVPLAATLADRVSALLHAPIQHGAVDVSFYRDDLGSRLPIPAPTQLPADITGRTVVLVDDVIQTARTVRAAFDALTDYGRPARIYLAVLVDRGGRELPIAPDFAGLTRDIPPDKKVALRDAALLLVDAPS